MTNTESTPYLGSFRLDRPLILTPAPNGGWTVTQQMKERTPQQTIGAFGNAQDMLTALTWALKALED